MVLEAVLCPSCQEPDAVYRHEQTRDGRQRHRCTACRRTFQLQYQHQVPQAGTRANITDMALSGNGIRATARGLGSARKR
ncbi:MAG: IS1 family transposase [Hymenobacter sp.]|nr:IS1 family transposase [Hymenobacter sp.]